MSAPITEAHLELAKTALFSRDNVGRLLTAPMAAQLIADSEARALSVVCGRHNALIAERDQLRAEVKLLSEWQQGVIENARAHHAHLKNANARAERAEAILGELQELHGCSREMIVHWCAHAAQRSLGLDQTRAELAAEREKAERYRLATLKLDAELAKEREKVRVLREALDEAQSCGGITGSIFMQARAALAATEDTK